MAWIYFQDTAELRTHFEDLSVRLPIVKLSEEHSAYFCDECERVKLQSPQSGTTCEHLRKPTSKTQSTSSQGVFPARIYLLQEMERAWMESEADFFSRSLGLWASFDRGLSSWKMCQLSLFEDSIESQVSWPRQGMIVGGECYQLLTWERSTKERESGFLPTPTATEGGYNQSDSPNAKIRPSLETMARLKMLPTPLASDDKGSSGQNRNTPHLSNYCETRGVKLNPQFVEVLMGLPIDATELEPWETDGSLKQQEKHSKDLSEAS